MLSLEQLILLKGEIPLCQCKDLQGNSCGNKVNVRPDKDGSYENYINKEYPKFLPGHHMIGKKHPEHSKLMSGSGNPMFENPRLDLQIKFKGEGNPMSGKESWNKGLTKEIDVRVKKISEGLKGIPKDQEHKDKISKTRIERGVAKLEKNPFFNKHHKPEIIEYLRRINLGRKDTPETCENRRLASIEMWKNPEHQENMQIIMKEVLSRPEVKAKLSDSWKNNNPMYDPKVIKIISEFQKNLWKDPEYRNKMSIALRNGWTVESRKNARKRVMDNYRNSINYNPSACLYFKQFDESNNTKGRYALYGNGEYVVPNLYYSLDYINFDLKLIIEFDEEHHYKNNILRERDVIRQQHIQSHFPDFKFIRIREKDLKNNKSLNTT